jgi:carbon monoxide dehydrogenase subunit G
MLCMSLRTNGIPTVSPSNMQGPGVEVQLLVKVHVLDGCKITSPMGAVVSAEASSFVMDPRRVTVSGRKGLGSTVLPLAYILIAEARQTTVVGCTADPQICVMLRALSQRLLRRSMPSSLCLLCLHFKVNDYTKRTQYSCV